MNMKENQIVDIDGFVHVVNGKVICFKSDVFDLENSEDVENLICFSEELYVKKGLPAIYGKDTICVLDAYDEDKNYIISMACIQGLSRNVQEKVMLILDGFN